MTSLKRTRNQKDYTQDIKHNAADELTPRRCATPMARARKPPIHVNPIPKLFKLKPMQIPALAIPDAPRDSKNKKSDDKDKKPENNLATQLPSEHSEIFPDTAVREDQIYTSDSEALPSGNLTETSDESTDRSFERIQSPEKKKIKIDTTGFPEIPPLPDLTKIVDTMPEEPPASISPYTFCESIGDLDDDQYQQFIEEDSLIVKSAYPYIGFTPEEYGGMLTTLSESKYKITLQVTGIQFMQLSHIHNYQTQYLECTTFREFANLAESHVCEIFGCRTALIWKRSKISKVLINYSHLMKYPQNRGFLGTCVNEKRPVIAPSPMQNPLFDEKYDLPLCEEAEMIAAVPIIDADEDEAIGCVLLIDKIHETGATFMYWPQSDIFLLKKYCDLLPRVFKRFRKEIENIQNDMHFVSRCVVRKHNLNHLISYVLSTVKSCVECNSCSLLIKLDNFVLFEASQHQLKYKVMKSDKLGISGKVMETKQPVNLLRGGSHPNFQKSIDEQARETNVLIIPIITNTGDVLGTCICRSRRKKPLFTDLDLKRLTKLMTEFAVPMIDALTIRRNSKMLKNAISGQNKLASLLQTAESLSKETNLNELINQILVNSKNLVDADRGSLFVVDDSGTLLISKVAHGTGQIVIPITTGLVGAAVQSREPINIEDAYQDARFNSNVDKKTGYHTKSLLTVPIADQTGNIVAVTQLMNKTNGASGFNEGDVELTKAMNVFTGIALKNSKSIDDANRTSDKIKALINTAHALANDSTSYILHQIAQTLTAITNCERCIIRSPGEKGTTNAVISSGKCIIIDDISSDSRYEQSPEDDMNFGLSSSHNFSSMLNLNSSQNLNASSPSFSKVKSVLAVPVRSISDGIIHVLELINKSKSSNGGKFTDEDVEIASGFASYIAIASEVDRAKTDFSSMLTVSLTSESAKSTIPPQTLITDIPNSRFDVLGLSEQEALKLCITIIYELQVMENKGITNDTILSVLLKLRSKVNLIHVASSLHLIYHILQTRIHAIFRPNDVVSLLCAILICKVEASNVPESCDEINQIDIALGAIFSIPSRKLELCEFAAELYENVKLPPKMWENLSQIILDTDPVKFFQNIKNLWALVKPTNQTSKNPLLVMKCLVWLVTFSDLFGPFQRTEEWAANRKLSPQQMVTFINFLVLPVINALSVAIPQLRPIGDQIMGNLTQWVSKIE